jgi:hypothetical protein
MSQLLEKVEQKMEKKQEQKSVHFSIQEIDSNVVPEVNQNTSLNTTANTTANTTPNTNPDFAPLLSKVDLSKVEDDIEYLLKRRNIKIKKETELINKNSERDKQFYKKRLYDLNRQLMRNEATASIAVCNSFENYINTCIDYFKILDRTDIIQEDYALLDLNTESNDNVGPFTVEDANKNMMRYIKIYQPNMLEKLVKRTITKVKTVDPIIPKQKDINLKDPILRTKGIVKKNNITNKYEN